eukprot:scaffold781_cov132-Cylindrotheca_fusiformis.AAC.5
METYRPSEFLGGSSYGPQYGNKQRRSWKPKAKVDASQLPSMFAAAASFTPPRRRTPQGRSHEVQSMTQPSVDCAPKSPMAVPQQQRKPVETTTIPSAARNAVTNSTPLTPTPQKCSLSVQRSPVAERSPVCVIQREKKEREPIQLKYLPKTDEDRPRDRPELNIPMIIQQGNIDADHVLKVLSMVNKESEDDLASIASERSSANDDDSELSGWDKIMRDKIDDFLGSHHSLPSNYCGDDSDSEEDSDSDSDGDDDEYSS